MVQKSSVIGQISRRRLMTAAAALPLMQPFASMAQDWPDKPIRLVVGFPAGGQSDIMARLIGESLARELGQPVIVDNKGGASGLIAAEFVAKQKADGYTIMLTSESLQTRAAAVFKKLPYDPVADFDPVGKFAKQRTLMVVHPSSSANSVQDFIKYAKANPGKLNYGATYSTSSQFGGALFSQLNGLEMVAVNYPGGAKPITDLLGGVVDVGFFVESTVAQHIKAGKLKLLASASMDRSVLFPATPTIAEGGGAFMDISPWFGLVMPTKAPKPIMQKISDCLQRAVHSPEFKQRLDMLGAVAIENSSPDAFTKDIQTEIAYWKKFVKDSKFLLLD